MQIRDPFRGGAPVEYVVLSSRRCALACALLWALSAFAQQIPDAPSIPRNFTLDFETAARLRPQLIAQSMPAAGTYALGRLVFDRLIAQGSAPAPTKFKWELRIVDDGQFNAYSSPDGTIYVETGLARLAGTSAGLWAAVLSHEIAHVLHRDWASRYLYQKALETGSAATLVLGDPGLPSPSGDAHWSDAQNASENFARFCRRLEIEADREGVTLMARAGYHPDFVPALHHLLHAQGSGPDALSVSLSAMHPCWEERDRELNRAYVDASVEFEHRWLDWHTSPGGNPPTLVFAEPPTVRKIGSNKKTGVKVWEILIPMHCENLVGAVEVVLRERSRSGNASSAPTGQPNRPANPPDDGLDSRQLTGCTSPRTTITFTLTDSASPARPQSRWTDVYVLDAWGGVLARADVPRLPR